MPGGETGDKRDAVEDFAKPSLLGGKGNPHTKHDQPAPEERCQLLRDQVHRPGHHYQERGDYPDPKSYAALPLPPANDIYSRRAQDKGPEQPERVHVAQGGQLPLGEEDNEHRHKGRYADREMRRAKASIAKRHDGGQKSTVRQREKDVIATDDGGVGGKKQQDRS